VTGEIGQLALCLALALALIQAVAGLMGVRLGGELSQSIARSTALGFFVFIVLSFGALTYGFVTSDFSIVTVAENSHTLKPLIYKITGVWGNHEGSMMLWVLVLAIYSAIMALWNRGGARLTSAALGVEGLLAAAFVLFILLTSNPFLRIDPLPVEGAGLNPLLQDPGLAMHPPMLYLGYVGLSATFAYAAAALITQEKGAAWARAARPFMLAAWIALTLGITLGSWWAYYVLGWGGFWFWDPVENAALMPWLVATALIHSTLATERTGAFRSWSLLLAIAAFSMSLIGTFLVRSGVLSSVHSFASDPERGEFILLLLGVAIGGALALFAWRAPGIEEGATFEPASRETMLLLNNVFLTAAAVTVFLGTLYPLLLDAVTGTRISVGPPYFAVTFAPIFIALLIIVPLGPRFGWFKGDFKSAFKVLWPGIGIAAIAAIFVLGIGAPHALAAAGAFALAFWLIASSIVDLVQRIRARSAGLPAFASILAHAGLGVTLLGITGTTLWRAEALDVLGPGQAMSVGGYVLHLQDVSPHDGPNYIAERATLDVTRRGNEIGVMSPEKRTYPAEGQSVTDTAIRTNGFSDLYVALGDERSDGRWTIRAYVNPIAPFIWFGGAIMALGGLAGLFSRLRANRATAAE
jgi:cytochrome c-type biogenesis protein CcmF